MMIFILIVIVAFVGLYVFGGIQHNKTVPPLSLKYNKLTDLLLKSHPQNRIWQDHNNKLIIGIKTPTAGNTLFIISEVITGEVSIIYQITNNPISKDFELRSTFTSETCQNNPLKALESLNKRVNDYIQNEAVFREQ